MSERVAEHTAITLFLVSILLATGFSSAGAQPAERPGNAFYGKIGAGFSDYTGDYPAQNASHPFDLQEFTRGAGFPFVFNGELGYRFSPSLALALGFQVGNYPIVGYAGGPSGISDSYRYTPQLLARYTFGSSSQTVAPYVDVGANATLGGDNPPASTGVGPSVGAGVDILLSRSLSFYIESRYNLTGPDNAIDGSDAASNDGITGPFDSVNQLVGFGLVFTFSSSTPPKVIALDGPNEVEVGNSATFAATVNEAEATRPLSYQWQFGDGSMTSGQTVSHVYEKPGTYTVTFEARNDAGAASQTLEVEVIQPSTPPEVLALDVPSETQVGESISFTATVNEEATRPLRSEWQFGDGTSSSGQTVSHAYEQPGTYTAVFTARNDAGEASESVTVSVTPSGQPAEITAINAKPNPARVGTSLRFSSTVDGDSPLTKEWDFGDGRTATGASPTHTYDEPGRYTVELEASNETSSDVRTLSVRVVPPLSERWSIIVASMSRREGAAQIAQEYRDQFSGSLPVTIMTTETQQGNRYRVAVGQFSERSEAQQALDRYSNQLPSDAWLLPPQ